MHRCRSLFKTIRADLRAQVEVAARTSASRGRARLMGTLRLGAGQPRAAAAHLWAGAAACLLAALVLCGAACTDAAMGVSAVRPSALARALLARLATRRLIPCGLSYNLSSMPHNGRAPVYGREAWRVTAQRARRAADNTPVSCAGPSPQYGAALCGVHASGGSRSPCNGQGTSCRASAGERAGRQQRRGRRQQRAGSGGRQLQPHQGRCCAAQRQGLSSQSGGAAARGQLVRSL